MKHLKCYFIIVDQKQMMMTYPMGGDKSQRAFNRVHMVCVKSVTMEFVEIDHIISHNQP